MYSEELKKLTSKRIRECRNEKGLSHASLATALREKYNIKISLDVLKNYEVYDEFHVKFGAVKGMNIEYLYCLSDFFSVSSDYLLGKSECKNPENQDIKIVTGLEEDTIFKLRTFKTKNFSHIVDRIISNINFFATISKMNELRELNLDDGYHVIIPNADFDALNNGKKGKVAKFVTRNVIESIYSTKAKKTMSKVIEEVLEEILGREV